jgi:glycosyltransferase involved in cell wall biosynthesis
LSENYEYVSDDTVDIIVASAKSLIDSLVQESKSTAERVVYVPNAVNYENYVSSGALIPPKSPLKSRFDGLKGPIIGYFGAIAPWLWYELINNVTLSMQDVNFVIIGPDYLGAQARLIERANVLLTGPIEYKFLKYYARRFHVAMIPFAQGEIGETTSPLKLYEYFALQVPVVTTSSMRECTQYDVVKHADNSMDFALELRKAIELRYVDSHRKKLQQLARSNTWDHRILPIIDRFLSLGMKDVPSAP